MNVAVNLVRFNSPRIGGNWFYVKGVLNGLQDQGVNLTCFIYDGAEQVRRELVPEGAKVVTVSGSNALAAMHASMPRKVAACGADVLFSPSHGLPFISPGIPEVVVIHDLNFRRLRMQKRKIAYKTLLVRLSAMRATSIICISEFTRLDVISVVPSTAAKTVVVQNGFSTDGQVHQEPDLSSVRMLAFGHHAHKNPEFAVKVLQQVLPVAGRNVELRVVSCPDDRIPRLESLAATLGVSDHCKFLPYVDDEELNALYRWSNVLLFPSSFEGFGLPVLEAMSRGIPVLSSAAGSLPEVCDDAALLFKELDENAWANGVVSLLDEERYRSWVVKGLRRAKQFSWERCAKETKQVLGNAIAKSRRAN